jgi:hypothetical protein
MFVHYAGPSLPKGGNSRSLIRSQAMKVSHRQRREKALLKGLEPASSTTPAVVELVVPASPDVGETSESEEDATNGSEIAVLYDQWTRWLSTTDIPRVSLAAVTSHSSTVPPRLQIRMANMSSHCMPTGCILAKVTYS